MDSTHYFIRMEYSQDSRLKVLEDRVAALEKAVFEGEQRSFSAMPSGRPSEYTTIHNGPRQPDSITLAFQWLAKDWLMKLGAFLLLLAVGWFVRYAFIQNWIGPSMRILLGMVAGLMLFALGNFVILSRRVPGQVLVATGVTMQFITMFAARNVYDFFTPMSALIIMGVIVVCMAASAVIHNSKQLAILAYFGGLIAPFLVNAPTTDHIGLLRYVFILDLGVFALIALRSWRVLLLLSLLGTGFYSQTFGNVSQSAAWIFMGLFYAFFLFSQVYVSIKTTTVTIIDTIIIGLSSLFFLGWTSGFVSHEWQGIVMATVGFAPLLVALTFSHQQGIKQADRSIMYLYLSAAIFHFVGGTIFQFDGEMLVTILSLESVLLVILAAFAVKSSVATEVISPFYLLPFVLSLSEDSFSREVWMNRSLFGDHFFAVLSLALAAMIAAVMLKRIVSDKYELMISHTIVGSIFSLSFVWLVLHNLIQPESTARGIALVIFSLVGVGLFFYGVRSQAKTYRLFGDFILGGVVLRLLAVEVWQMPLIGRVITFLLIGLLLLATAFFEKNSKSEK